MERGAVLSPMKTLECDSKSYRVNTSAPNLFSGFYFPVVNCFGSFLVTCPKIPTQASSEFAPHRAGREWCALLPLCVQPSCGAVPVPAPPGPAEAAPAGGELLPGWQQHK